jgi:demethylmenaquinone methyltransferase/2-methoxy-6-polyprenyl-1,4-benzoquinol methylase
MPDTLVHSRAQRPAAIAFDRAAPRYDLLNTLMSWGRDGAWRAALAEPLRPGERVLDLCGGSGRSSVAAYRRTGAPVVLADRSRPMLRAGVAHARGSGAACPAVECDALRLPFPDRTFDAVTLAWGLRNLEPEGDALREIQRVLRPGGRLLVLDSPAPEPGVAGSLHRLYLRVAVPLLGRLSPDPGAYRYLADSVLAFGRAGEVRERLQAAGLAVEPPRALFLGAAAIWRAVKPADRHAPGSGQNATPVTAGIAGTA